MSAVGEGAPADPAAEAAAAAPPPEGAAGAAEGAAALVDAGDGAQTPLSTPNPLLHGLQFHLKRMPCIKNPPFRYQHHHNEI